MNRPSTESDLPSGSTSGVPERVLVVVNRFARQNAGEALAALRQAAPPGTEMIIQILDPMRGDAGKNVWRTESVSKVVAVGGDGTVSTVADAAVTLDVPLGIIPAGSTNMIAKVSRVPSDTQQAADLIFGEHQIQTIDVGRSGERYLLHLGGAGFDADVFRHSSAKLKHRLGWMAYLPAGVRSLPGSLGQFHVEVDNERFDGPARMVLVANSAELINTSLKLYPSVSRTDGEFDVLVFTPRNIFELAQMGMNYLTRRIVDSDQVLALRGRTIRIEAEPKRCVEIDGELAGTTPFAIDVVPQALDIICGPEPAHSRLSRIVGNGQA